MAKAFQSINHDVLLYKMSKTGFKKLFKKMALRSYLTGTQVVKFGLTVSNEMPIITGIGQGTILGPLLFIFYINDIVTTVHHLKINMYADDCILYISEWNRMIQKIQPEVTNVQRWCLKNRLKISISKSKVLLFGSRNKSSKVDYSSNIILGNQSLSFVKNYRYKSTNI